MFREIIAGKVMKLVHTHEEFVCVKCSVTCEVFCVMYNQIVYCAALIDLR